MLRIMMNVVSYHYHCYRVTKSNNAEYPVGTVFTSSLGWRTHTVVTPELLKTSLMGTFKVDPSLPISPSTALGVLGMPG